MHIFQRLVALILLAASSLVWAAPFENEVFRLDVPSGFGGPIFGKMDDQSTVVAFTKAHAGASTSTLLQVTTYNPGASASPPKEQLGALADKYLPQFLAGIERRRSSYTATAPRRVTLGGIPASVASWSGMLEGAKAHGTHVLRHRWHQNCQPACSGSSDGPLCKLSGGRGCYQGRTLQDGELISFSGEAFR